jgi:hypothetical protein
MSSLVVIFVCKILTWAPHDRERKSHWCEIVRRCCNWTCSTRRRVGRAWTFDCGKYAFGRTHQHRYRIWVDFISSGFKARQQSGLPESLPNREAIHHKPMNGPFLRPLLGKFWCAYFFDCAAGACSLDGGIMFLRRM